MANSENLFVPLRPFSMSETGKACSMRRCCCFLWFLMVPSIVVNYLLINHVIYVLTLCAILCNISWGQFSCSFHFLFVLICFCCFFQILDSPQFISSFWFTRWSKLTAFGGIGTGKNKKNIFCRKWMGHKRSYFSGTKTTKRTISC